MPLFCALEENLRIIVPSFSNLSYTSLNHTIKNKPLATGVPVSEEA
jgi:hypothetical protein